MQQAHGLQKTAFAYVLGVLVMSPGILIVAVRQLPGLAVPLLCFAIAGALAFQRPLARLWADPSSRHKLLAITAFFAVAAVVLEALRHTDGPFMAFALLVLLPGLGVAALLISCIQRLAWVGCA